ncbi:MAG TPA: prolyl oligopeptidase family serine peptidase [Pirellulales bacterium]|nr:prolyl oligopeptidase family serine peptidase [Pirellulales bacterium]
MHPVRPPCGYVFLALACLPVWAGADETDRLPDTEPLTWEGDLSARMLDGAHRFIDRKIQESVLLRPRHWRRDVSSPEAYEKSIEPNRGRFARQIGMRDERLLPAMERFGDDDCPALVAATSSYRVHQVRWPVLDGVWGEGLLLEPSERPAACVVVMGDADQTPEQLVGLAPGVEPAMQWASILANSGCLVVVPTLVDRTTRFTGNPISGRPNPGYSHREWIYRQAYHMGRHVIGYEVQKVLAAVDWFAARSGRQDAPPCGVAGYGEGGLLALYAAAVDRRIDSTLVSGYFRSRQRVAEEPLYRNVWALLHEFGDAEIASLIAPRSLTIEYRKGPELVDRQTTTPAQVNGVPLDGVHGRLQAPDWSEVAAEFARIEGLVPDRLQPRRLVDAEDTTGPAKEDSQSLEAFCRELRVDLKKKTPATLTDSRGAFDPLQRQRRQVKALEDHVQALVNDSHLARERFCKVNAASVDAFTASTRPLRDYAWRELFGKFDDRLLASRPRSRPIYRRPNWTGYEVVLDVLPDLFAWGVLLVPADLKPGEKRPVVVCQHGRNGLPKHVIEGDEPAYHDFAARLADEGFIVFAPHNPYRGEDRYRWLSRKANGVKASLFSFILAQHEQILNWLESLPFVDREKIAFYGLSYGGETAVRVPPLLDRYRLSICSADFNDWARKVASTHSPYSFMYTIEWEMPYFDMGSTFSYAELANLMVPRPFMVERGHGDGVAPDEWVAHEYAKVRRTYDQLGLGDRTAIEVFNGGHTINGHGTFEFLHRHLR